MPTLNKAKKETQIIFKWGGIAIGIIFLFLLGIRFLTFVKESLTPPPPPQASFGKLTPIPFPNQLQENITYSLDTLTGYLPNFSNQTKVYKIITDPPTLLGLQKTREKVAQIGFNTQETKIAEDVYQWTDQDPGLQRRITINIYSSDFTISSPFLAGSSLQTLISSAEKDNSIEIARSFLVDMALFPADIDENKTKISNSGTKIIRVDFFQKDLDGLPIYYEKGISSNIDLLLGKENNELKVVNATYFHKNISQISSTYAIKSATQAFSELQKGKGYIAHKNERVVEVTIKEVFLGYYIGELEQEFLMPIIVFIGDNDFVGYVSAVTDEWISN